MGSLCYHAHGLCFNQDFPNIVCNIVDISRKRAIKRKKKMKSSDFFLKSVMKRFSSNGEGIIDIFLLSKKIFNRYQYICLPILNFPLTRGGHLVLNIRFWSTDSYSKTVTPTKVFAPSVLNRLVWRRKTLTAFSHNFS